MFKSTFSSTLRFGIWTFTWSKSGAGPGEAEPSDQKGTGFRAEDPPEQTPEWGRGEGREARRSRSACCVPHATHLDLPSRSQWIFPAAWEKAVPHLADQEPGPQRSRWSQQGTQTPV